MKHYTIKVSVNDPYPKHFDYRENGSAIHVAIARALRKFREEQWKGRPLKAVNITAIFYGSDNESTNYQAHSNK